MAPSRCLPALQFLSPGRSMSRQIQPAYGNAEQPSAASELQLHDTGNARVRHHTFYARQQASMLRPPSQLCQRKASGAQIQMHTLQRSNMEHGANPKERRYEGLSI